jgi:hypothetical protein
MMSHPINMKHSALENHVNQTKDSPSQIEKRHLICLSTVKKIHVPIPPKHETAKKVAKEDEGELFTQISSIITIKDEFIELCENYAEDICSLNDSL